MNDRPRASVRAAVRTALLAAAFSSCVSVFADEGMWTFDAFPAARLEREHGVSIDEAWLERIRLGTARLSNRTASCVSPQGLILTNRHRLASRPAEHSHPEE